MEGAPGKPRIRALPFYDLDHLPMRTENDNGRRRNPTHVDGNPSLDEDELFGKCVLFYDFLD
jgi:hypothetical protein